VVQTDNPDYWKYMLEVLPSFFEFREQIGPWPDAQEGRTRREILARARGLTIYRGFGSRRDEATPERVTSLAQSLPQPVFRSRGPWCELDHVE
jgi:tRNA (guanine-N7-)-methyltransferase